MAKYYTLAVCWKVSGWVGEYGSFDKADVLAERQDWRDKGTKASNLAVLITDSKGGQLAINAALSSLPARTSGRHVED